MGENTKEWSELKREELRFFFKKKEETENNFLKTKYKFRPKINYYQNKVTKYKQMPKISYYQNKVRGRHHLNPTIYSCTLVQMRSNLQLNNSYQQGCNAL